MIQRQILMMVLVIMHLVQLQLLIIKISTLVHYQLELAYLTNGRFLLQQEVLGYLQEILVMLLQVMEELQVNMLG